MGILDNLNNLENLFPDATVHSCKTESKAETELLWVQIHANSVQGGSKSQLGVKVYNVRQQCIYEFS